MGTPVWQALMVRGELSPRLVADATDASGVYAVREKDSHRVVYVGESSRGVLWKTLLRHFQAPESFQRVRERGIFTGDPAKYEVAIEVTSRGPRPRPPAAGSPESARIKELRRRGVAFTTDADQKALDLQAEWLANLKAAGHELLNVDDGLAFEDDTRACSACGGDGEDLMGEPCEVCGGSGRVVKGNPGSLFEGDEEDAKLFVRTAKKIEAPHIYGDGVPYGNRAKDPPFSIIDKGAGQVWGIGSRDMADWIIDALRTARTDARAHAKPTDLVDAPPVPRGEWFSRSSGEHAEVFRRDDTDRSTHFVAMAKTRDLAGLVVDLAQIGWSFRGDSDAMKAATAERKRLGVTHALRVGDRVTWTMQDHRGWRENVGTVAELLRDNRVKLWPWQSGRRGGKSKTLQKEPTVVSAGFLELVPPSPPKKKPKPAARRPPKVTHTAPPSSNTVPVGAKGVARLREKGDPVKRWLSSRRPSSADDRQGWIGYRGEALASHAYAKEKGASAEVLARIEEEYRAAERALGLLGVASFTLDLDEEDEAAAAASLAGEAVRVSLEAKQAAEAVHKAAEAVHAAAKAAVAPKPAGYGTEVTGKKKRGQLIMFNPSGPRDRAWVEEERARISTWSRDQLLSWLEWNDGGNREPDNEEDVTHADLVDEVMTLVEENRASPEEMRFASRRNPSRPKRSNPGAPVRGPGLPAGGLVELGLLTLLEQEDGRVLAWSLRDAPVLGYDTRGKLFIVYEPGRVIRPSNASELRSYDRTHWGAKGRGDCRGGGVVVAPFRSHGPGAVITYTTRKGTDRELVDYRHEWGEGGRGSFTPPTVVEHVCERCGPKCAAKGAIGLAGGSYKVNDRGIVG